MEEAEMVVIFGEALKQYRINMLNKRELGAFKDLLTKGEITVTMTLKGKALTQLHVEPTATISTETLAKVEKEKQSLQATVKEQAQEIKKLTPKKKEEKTQKPGIIDAQLATKVKTH